MNKELKGDKLFDENSIDERKMIKDGEVEDHSSGYGPTSIEVAYGPFIGRQVELH